MNHFYVNLQIKQVEITSTGSQRCKPKLSYENILSVFLPENFSCQVPAVTF